MKQLLPAILFAVVCTASISCNKEVFDPFSSSNSKISIQLFSFGSNDPAPNVQVLLADIDTFTNTGPDFTYFNDYSYNTEATLGITDAEGKLEWSVSKDFNFQGKVLIALANADFFEQKIGLSTLDKSKPISASLFPVAYVRVKVIHQDSTDAPADYFAIQKRNESYPWRFDQLASGLAGIGSSVELIARVKGNTKNNLLVEQHYNNYSFAHTQKTLPEFFVARNDTAYVEIGF